MGKIFIPNGAGSGMTNPMSTGGDIIYGAASGTPSKLSNGSAGQLLRSAGGTNAPTWSFPGYTYTSQTANYNATINDWVVCSSSSFAVTLPTAASVSGQGIVIQHNGTSLTQKYTINTTGGQTVGGLSSGGFILTTSGETVWLVSDGSNWQIINHKTKTGWVSAGTPAISATSAYVFSWTGNQNIVQGDTYTDGAGNTFTVTTSANTTSGTFSGTPGTPASTGTLTRATGTGVASVAWTSRTTTGQPVFGTTSTNTIHWSRDGQFATVRWILNQTGAGTAGSGDYILYLPQNLVVDSSIPVYVTNPATSMQTIAAVYPSMQPMFGNISTTAVFTFNSMFAVPYSTTSLRMFETHATPTVTSVNLGSGGFALSGAALLWYLEAKLLIQDWQP